MTGGRRGKESGKERGWGGKGERGKKKTGGTDNVLVCTDRLDGPNTPVGMVSPPFSATNDNSSLYEDEEEDWDKMDYQRVMTSYNDNDDRRKKRKNRRWRGKGEEREEEDRWYRLRHCMYGS